MRLNLTITCLFIQFSKPKNGGYMWGMVLDCIISIGSPNPTSLSFKENALFNTLHSPTLVISFHPFLKFHVSWFISLFHGILQKERAAKRRLILQNFYHFILLLMYWCRSRDSVVQFSWSLEFVAFVAFWLDKVFCYCLSLCYFVQGFLITNLQVIQESSAWAIFSKN